MNRNVHIAPLLKKDLELNHLITAALNAHRKAVNNLNRTIETSKKSRFLPKIYYRGKLEKLRNIENMAQNQLNNLLRRKSNLNKNLNRLKSIPRIG